MQELQEPCQQELTAAMARSRPAEDCTLSGEPAVSAAGANDAAAAAADTAAAATTTGFTVLQSGKPSGPTLIAA